MSLPTDAKPEKITLRIFRRSTLHVERKKIHYSQRILARSDNGSLDVELTVVVNYELIGRLLGFGSAVKVLGPEGVVLQLQEEISNHKILS